MAESELVKIPAGHGKAARLRTGQKLKLINTHGTQVVDFWAFNAYDLREYMCVASSRVWNKRLWPKAGDVMVTTQRRPIVCMTEDTTPGIHDTVMSACDRHRYGLLGVEGYHRNCQDNMFEGMLELGVTPPFPISASWNIFMNIPVLEDRYSLDFKPTVSKPGQYIVLRAEMDCYMAFSACPQDILPIHGEGGAPPRDCHFQILD
ncbi:MAG TPA: urea carboxylase-associated family protein [Pseudomonadales bacterium]